MKASATSERNTTILPPGVRHSPSARSNRKVSPTGKATAAPSGAIKSAKPHRAQPAPVKRGVATAKAAPPKPAGKKAEAPVRPPVKASPATRPKAPAKAPVAAKTRISPKPPEKPRPKQQVQAARTPKPAAKVAAAVPSDPPLPDAPIAELVALVVIADQPPAAAEAASAEVKAAEPATPEAATPAAPAHEERAVADEPHPAIQHPPLAAAVPAEVVPEEPKLPAAVPAGMKAVAAKPLNGTSGARPAAPARALAKEEVFVEGDYVVYPTHGVGKVEKIAIEDIAGHRLELIHITFEENRMTLRVPVAKARSAGLRKLATQEKFEEALNVLRGRARIKRTMWSRRAQEYEAKINSGDPIAIAEVVRDLHRNAGQPDQSFSERQIYESAVDRLAAELAALDATDKPTAAAKLVTFLKVA
jgi:CarD family transcriptional regulator